MKQTNKPEGSGPINWKTISSSKYFVPGFTLVFGLILISLAVVRVVKTESFIEHAEMTSGTVLESHQGMLVWSATITVAYVDAIGASREAIFETGVDRATHKQGDTVHLLYDPQDTSSVYVGNPRRRRHPMSAIYFLLGAALIFFTFRSLREDT